MPLSVSETNAKSARDYSAGSLLVAVVLASILPFLLVGSFLLFAYVKSERDVALERVITLAASLSAAVDRKLASYMGNLETLAGALHVDADDPRASWPSLEQARNP